MNRILDIKNIEEAREELKKINVSSQGVEVMSPKALGCSIKLTDVKLGAANILKQEMLSVGGDAAVARGVVNGKEEFSDVILLGNADKIKKLIKKLKHQTIFDLPKIQNDLQIMLTQLLGTTKFSLNCAGKDLDLSKTRVMGILNVTPDSFSDGSKFMRLDNAIAQAKEMIANKVDIIDIGGESTRPGADSVSTEEELKRVIPVIKAIRVFSDVIISIDTSKAVVASEAIAAGADIINDVSALEGDEKMLRVLQENPDIPIILMHKKGTPQTMQINPYYDDVIDEIISYLADKINFCESNGIAKERIVIDPGIGFGKRQEDNLKIIQRLKEFHTLGVPILLGTSRKGFIAKIYDSTPEEREEATLATTAFAFQSGVQIVRVHSVLSNVRLLQTLQAIKDVK
jgi:dihydropteroate synthase